MTGLSINKQLYEILSGDTVLSGSCQDVFPLVAEEDVKYPFILYTRTDVKPMGSKNCIAGDSVGFSIAIVSNKYLETLDIAERVRQLLEFRRDGYFNQVTFTGCTEDFIQDAYVQRLNFTAVILQRETNN